MPHPTISLGAFDRYVAEGGHLIATFRTGFADEQLKIHHDVQPHLLGRCLGIHYDQFTYPKNVRIATTDGRSALTHDWMELVTCDTATTRSRIMTIHSGAVMPP